MTTPPSPRRSGLKFSQDAPTGRRALAAAVLWLLIAAIATGASICVASHGTSSVALRILATLLLVAVSTTALMLASDSVERSLDGRLSRWSGRLQWLTTSLVALSVVVASGLVLSSVAPDRPGLGNVALDFLIDLGVGAGLGAVSIGLILGVAAGLGEVIWLVARRLGPPKRAERWQRSPQAGNRRRREVGRGAALGCAGLLLSALCGALVTAVTTNHNGAVDVPAPREASFPLTVGLPVLSWFLGTGFVWLLFARRHGDTFKPHHRLRHGTHASALSVCLVIGAAWLAAAGLDRHARGELASGAAGSVPTVSITDQQASRQSSYLAQKFEPQLRLTSGERWNPTAVTWYVQRNPRPNTDPPFCSAHKPGQPPAGCYQISASCDVPDPGPCAVNGANDPALYYRYVEQGNADRSPSGPSSAWTLIQYWVFYNYDSLRTWAVTQWHQADWEQVSVLVRRAGSSVRPVEVAFSEHCSGARLPAERVRWTDGSHPVVFVARGSHANYPRPVSVPVRQLRCSLGVTPRYLGVAGLFYSPAVDGSRLEIPVAYLAGLRDRADGTRPAPLLRLVPLDTATAINSFDGHWGLDNNLSPFGVGVLRLRSSAGPPAPQTQDPWTTPFKSMLCSGSWLSTQAVPRSETAWICGSRSP